MTNYVRSRIFYHSLKHSLKNAIYNLNTALIITFIMLLVFEFPTFSRDISPEAKH